MGKKGETRTTQARATADATVDTLGPLGGVSARGMFGGYGIFKDGVMFGLVNRQGELHLRVNDDTRPEYEAAGCRSHGSMPYYTVPESIARDGHALRTWAEEAAELAAAAKPSHRKRRRTRTP